MADDGHARAMSDRSQERNRQAGASRITVLVALAANAFVALVKLAGGLLSGSAALLAEAAHSAADTTNQAFLLVSLSLSRRRPTAEHPFGEGRQRFLWTFVAALGTFLAGAVFAVGYGAMELVRGPSEEGSYGIAWATLAIAGVAETISWIRAVRQARAEARETRTSVIGHVARTRDPNVKMVVFEDTAAIAGIAIAAAGIALSQLTGEPAWDPIASIVIGVLLIGVGLRMAHDAGEMLIGHAARPEERRRIEAVLEAHEDVQEVVELLTVVLGPTALLVAARIDLRDDADGARIERTAGELDRAVREAVPDVTEVFLDPTPGRRGAAGTGAAPTRGRAPRAGPAAPRVAPSC